MKMQKIMELKLELDRIKEYVDSDLCKQCEQMNKRLQECENLMNDYINEYKEGE